MVTLPTRKEIYDSIIASFEAEYDTNISTFGKVFIRAIASVQAGKLWLIYKAIGNSQKNIAPDTADSEAFGGTLERFGRIKLGRNPYGAIAGQYTATITGTTGAFVKANTTFKSNDNALNPSELYTLDNDFTLGSGLITIRALTAGLDGALNVGDQLTVTSPIANVDSIITISAQTVQPQSAETLEDYRRKVLDSYRLEPQGGSGADYRIWASDAHGVRQSYPYTSNNISEVDLYIEATLSDSSDGFGTPTQTILDAVETAIETPTADRPARKPLTVKVNYLPVVIKEINITINSFVGITNEIKASILSAMTTELNTIRPFVGSVDVLSDRNDRLDANKIVSIILASNPGSVFGAIQLTVDGINQNSVTFDSGAIPHLNTITYV